MAHALPTITSDVGGISGIIDYMHSGLIVTPADSFALQRAVDLLIGDPLLLADPGRAVQKVASRYTRPNLNDELALLFDSAVTA